jgi:predicted DNA-binding transcriptional regulator AlpA
VIDVGAMCLAWDLEPHADTECSMQTQILNNEEAAGYLRRSQSFLNKKRCSGGGPRFVRIGSRIGYLRTDLDDWLAAQRRWSTSDPGQPEACKLTSP